MEIKRGCVIPKELEMDQDFARRRFGRKRADSRRDTFLTFFNGKSRSSDARGTGTKKKKKSPICVPLFDIRACVREKPEFRGRRSRLVPDPKSLSTCEHYRDDCGRILDPGKMVSRFRRPALRSSAVACPYLAQWCAQRVIEWFTLA